MKVIEALHEKNENGFMIQSPGVGYISALPAKEQMLTDSDQIGILRILGREFSLTLPVGITGKVMEVEGERQSYPVQYKENILALVPIDSVKLQNKNSSKKQEVRQEKGHVVYAPTHGIFYRKPSPDSSPYVEEGSVVKTGQILGLVEVMKCFNHILFEGAHLPKEGKIVKICAEDGAEIEAQQALFIFE